MQKRLLQKSLKSTAGFIIVENDSGTSELHKRTKAIFVLLAQTKKHQIYKHFHIVQLWNQIRTSCGYIHFVCTCTLSILNFAINYFSVRKSSAPIYWGAKYNVCKWRIKVWKKYFLEVRLTGPLLLLFLFSQKVGQSNSANHAVLTNQVPRFHFAHMRCIIVISET